MQKAEADSTYELETEILQTLHFLAEDARIEAAGSAESNVAIMKDLEFAVDVVGLRRQTHQHFHTQTVLFTKSF